MGILWAHTGTIGCIVLYKYMYLHNYKQKIHGCEFFLTCRQHSWLCNISVQKPSSCSAILNNRLQESCSQVSRVVLLEVSISGQKRLQSHVQVQTVWKICTVDLSLQRVLTSLQSERLVAWDSDSDSLNTQLLAVETTFSISYLTNFLQKRN